MNPQRIQSRLNSLGLSVADHVSAMLAYWDKDLICRFANTAYLDWFGKNREEMIDKITIKELLGPLYEKNLPYITGALEGTIQTFERDITTPTGEVRSALANYFPEIENGEVKGFFVHVADITPIKLLEEEIIKSNEIIREQNKRLLNFANIVSHNLKSYANNFNSLLDIMVHSKSQIDKEKTLNYLIDISKGFGTTVNNLNEIADAQNAADLRYDKIILYDFIERGIETLRVEINASDAVILNHVNKDITIKANPAYIESIIINFLTNAIKYRYPNRKPLIEVDAAFKNNELIWSFKDNGLGINLTKHKENLFGMYQTFHNNANAKGIGLYITKFHVDTMGGHIDVVSEENVGTTFYIKLPIKE
jgi:PAS domain S-box-containing protein